MCPADVKIVQRLAVTAWLMLLVACGGGGESDVAACSLCGNRNDIRGSIASQTGSQAQMAGWLIASFEKDTGIARASEIDSAGLFSFSQVRTEKSHTLALFSPNYRLMGVLSTPNEKVPTTIKQFFQYRAPNLPKLIHKHSTIAFQDYQGITVGKDLASDQNSDGTPDGWQSIEASAIKLWEDDAADTTSTMLGLAIRETLALQGSSNDIDQDGIPNARDADIDGDGLINWLDPDDDGDGIRDPLDGDQNGDLVNDAAPSQENIDLYFKEGVEYIAVQLMLKPKTDGSKTNETSLKFVTKVRKDITPLAIQIRGAPSLLNGATYTAPDSNGTPTVVAWNRLLADDGQSEDNSKEDRIFAKRINLAGSQVPMSHQVLFFQLVFGTKDKPWYMEFPFTFSDLKPAAVTAQYESNSRSVLLIGKPFGEQIQDFLWSINLWNSDQTSLLWTSKTQAGTERTLTIPESVLTKGTVYKFTVVAQTMDKVPGYPAYVVQSESYEISY